MSSRSCARAALLLLGLLGGGHCVPHVAQQPDADRSGPISGKCVKDCPAWPSALHLEGDVFITTTASEGGSNATVTAHGTVTWDTLGDAATPRSSLSYTRRHETMVVAGQPGESNQTAELWQICPQHAQFRSSSDGLFPTSCTKLPQPCFHRYDPISLALAACSSWSLETSGEARHHSGTKCDFAGFHVPGQTGTFDVWFADGQIQKFVTNTTFLSPGSSAGTITSEAVTVTSVTENPNVTVLRSACTPS